MYGITLVWKIMNCGFCRRASPLSSLCSIDFTSGRPFTSLWPEAGGPWTKKGYLGMGRTHQELAGSTTLSAFPGLEALMGGLVPARGHGRLEGSFCPSSSEHEQLSTFPTSVGRVCMKWEKASSPSLTVSWKSAFWRHLVHSGVICDAF